MARRKWNKRRGGRRKRRRTQSKLADKRINTLVEKRIQQISRAEDRKLLQYRIFRQFPSGVYSYGTNTFSGQPIDNAGLIYEVGQVQKQATNISGAVELNGKRVGNVILVTGFQLLLKTYLPENNSQATIENVVLSYRLSCVTDEWNPLSSSPYTPNAISIDDTLPWYPFGYSRVLDAEVTQIFERRRVKHYIKGSVSHRSTETHAQSTMVKRFYKFKKPLEVMYDPADTAGTQTPLQHKFFLSFRTNTPIGYTTDMKPHVNACIKTYYHEPL